MTGPRVLLTLPVYNERTRLESSIERLGEAIRESGLNCRIAIAEDGSTDGTKLVLDRLRAQRPDLIIQSEAVRRGRGYALRRLWPQVPADIYCFTDVDLASGPGALMEAVRLVAGGEKLVTGSRYCPGARVNRPPLRSLVSMAYNRLMNVIFDERVRDHQCGLKAFDRSVIDEVLPITHEDSWFWDTEILVVAEKLGFPVREIPVVWREGKTRRTSIRRLVSDLFLHGAGSLRLKGEISQRVSARLRRLAINAANPGPGAPRAPGETRPSDALAS